MKRFLIVMVFSVAFNVAAQQGLLVSELLFQPQSGEAEYVELYNTSDVSVELSDYHIVRWVGDSLGKHYPLPAYTVMPHGYVALTKDAASVSANYTVRYASRLLECNLPTYPNGGGRVVLSTVDSVVVDSFDYIPTMHSRLLRNKAGVSLERRSFDRPTNEASNWFSAASTAGYGTPGYENSQSSEYLVEESNFDFSATLLSPDGDGYQDELTIEYVLDEGGLTARVDVLNAAGTVVRRLLNNAILGTHGTVSWDGRDENGHALPRGQYIINISVFDTVGTRQTFRRVVAIL